MSRLLSAFIAKIGGQFAANHQSAPGVSDMASVAKIKDDGNFVEANWLIDNIQKGKRQIFWTGGLLTPALAELLLERNPDNRRINNTVRAKIARDIMNADWELNGEVVIVSNDGLLNDGQTRCSAVLDTGIAIPTGFCFGASRPSRKTVDMGAARNAAHFLAMDGLSHPKERAAIARWALAYEDSDKTTVIRAHSFGATELYHRARDDRQIEVAAEYVAENRRKIAPYAPPAAIGFCRMVFGGVNSDEAETFIDQVVFGENIVRDSAAYVVRNRLLVERNKFVRIELLFRGFVAHVAGKGNPTIRLSKSNTLPDLKGIAG